MGKLETRDNFFGGVLLPIHGRAPHEYWPTDEEFALIEELVVGGYYAALLRQRLGANAPAAYASFPPYEVYDWLCGHLRVYAPEGTPAEAQVKRALVSFVETTVKPARGA